MTIGIDLGGTNVRVALVDDGKILNVVSEPTKSKASQEEVLDHFKGLIKSVITPQVTAIGMGVPAVVDLETGTVYDVVAIPSWKEVPVKAILEARKAYQVEGGAWYPESIEGWKSNSRVVANGNCVMLIAYSECDAVVDAFNGLF